MITNKKIGVISLGCDKNRVDTEKMLATLSQRHVLTDDINSAEIIIINTCAFIEPARKEGITEILGAGELKLNGNLEKLIVTGCIPQKYAKEIFEELKEVDAFLGVSDYDKILDVIDGVYFGERINAVGCTKLETQTKRVLTTNGYAYLKIADGCNNHCTYCTIPSIRGRYRSIPKERLIEEAIGLGEVEELILVAQDVTKYGVDLEEKTNLVSLIQDLSKLDNVKRIRLLYCYPESITDELIAEISDNAKVVKYLDIPLQHASDRILKLMNRKGSGQDYLTLINRLKTQVKGIALRSTFITGFPTETDEDFETLLDFINKSKFFNVGFFKYNKEDGTPAGKMQGQVSAKIKTQRYKKLYSTQKRVVKENAKQLIGSTVEVFAEGFDENEMIYYGRAYFNAPDIDGKVYFFSSDEVEYGKVYKVKLLKASEYDFYGERL